MSIEEQIAALEARIQQCIILASGCTERAESAATRAEEAAARAELAAQVGSETAQAAAIEAVASAQAADVAALAAIEAAEIAVIEEEMIEEGIEDADQKPELVEGGSTIEGETGPEVPVLDGKREAEEGTQQPIVIEIKQSAPKQPQFFKPNNTRFRRGRTA